MRSIMILIFWFKFSIQNADDLEYGEGLGSPQISRSLKFMAYARGLPNGFDHFNGLPDAYLVYYKQAGAHLPWRKYLETEPIIDTTKPNWKEVFVDGDIQMNTGQSWRFEVWDYDPIGPNDYIGSVTMSVEELVLSNDTFLPKQIVPAPGYLIFRKV